MPLLHLLDLERGDSGYQDGCLILSPFSSSCRLLQLEGWSSVDIPSARKRLSDQCTIHVVVLQCGHIRSKVNLKKNIVYAILFNLLFYT